jgi:hypothetical protein
MLTLPVIKEYHSIVKSIDHFIVVFRIFDRRKGLGVPHWPGNIERDRVSEGNPIMRNCVFTYEVT